MPNSPSSSNASAACRLEWRPSRWLALALCAIGVLAALSVLSSGMPVTFAVPLALTAAGQGVRLARREARRPSHLLTIAPDGRAALDGIDISDLRLHWRGPWAFLHFRGADGRSRRLAWWTDTLAPRDRRELRLAVPVQPAAQSRPSMAS